MKQAPRGCVTRTQGCLVLRVGFFPAVAGCLGPFSCAPVLVLLVRARGLAFRLGVSLLGFPAVVCAVTPFPTIASLCNARLRNTMLL